MAAIFLSYAREDRRFAEIAARVLEGAGHSVWWDSRIGGGEEFSAQIEAALGEADVVLVAWSQESVKSRWVRDEASVGGDTGRLVPVTIDGSLPAMGFRQFHTLDLTGWKGGKRDRRTAELLASVERRLNGKAKAAMPASTAARGRGLAWPHPRAVGAIAAALLLVIAAGVALFLWDARQAERGPAPKPTIALLPFNSPSPGAELREIAAQARGSISHSLSQTGIPVRLVESAAAARRSGGDFLLSGQVTRSGEKVTATVHLDEAIHGVTVFTQSFDAAGDDVGNLPDRIGAHVASLLDASLMILDRRRPMDPALMAELFSGSVGDYIGNYQIRKRVAAKAPDEPAVLIGLAFFTGLALGEIPRDERPRAVVQARLAAEKALKLAPAAGGTYASWCFLHSESRLAECEDRIRKGTRIDPNEPWLREFLAGVMRTAGRFNEASELTNLSYTHNPYSYFMIRPMMRTLEFTGDSEMIGEVYPAAVRWYPGGKASFFRNRLYGLLYRGDFEAMRRLEEESADDLPADYVGSGAIADALKSKSQAALRKICAPATQEEFLLALRCMIAFPAVGDQDSAYAIADKFYPRRVGRTPEETERIWLDDPDGGKNLDFITSPGAAPLRRDPRYIALAERTGLLAYWRSGRLPDFCRKNPEPVCARLRKPA